MIQDDPPTTIVEELKQDLEDVANFKGSPLEKRAALYCKRLGINYNKLSDAEDKERFEKWNKMIFRYEDMTEYANFTQGFRLGAMLVFEIFSESESE